MVKNTVDAGIGGLGVIMVVVFVVGAYALRAEGQDAIG